ncbi:MAG: DUF5702 domain-containing protein [Lachnospiraceae bacterium]
MRFWEDEHGSVTIFLSLLLVALLGISLILMNYGKIYQGNTKVLRSMQGAGEHILADYNQALAEQYHLYFLDETYNGKSEEILINRIQNYMETHLGDFYDISIEDVAIDDRKYVFDEGYQAMQEQIEDEMELMVMEKGKEWLEETMKGLDGESERKTVDEQINSELQKQEAALAPSQDGQVVQSSSDYISEPPTVEDPRDSLRKVLRKGMLAFITDQNPLLYGESKYWKQESKAFSGLKELSDFMKRDKTENSSILSYGKEKMALLFYANEHFKSYVEQPVSFLTRSEYEWEYLIGGETEDGDNIAKTANKILVMRMPQNMAVAFSSSSLRQEARGISTALVGTLCVPGLVEATECLLLATLSYAETLVEIRALLRGEEIVRMKQEGDWNVSLHGITQLKNQTVQSGRKDTMKYQDYLSFLLLVQDGKTTRSRMAEIMEKNLQIDNPCFEMKHCLSSFSLFCRTNDFESSLAVAY